MLLGIGVVIAAEFANRSLRSPGESAFHLQVPELGVIPASEMRPSATRVSPSEPPIYTLNGNGISQHECVELATWQSQDLGSRGVVS